MLNSKIKVLVADDHPVFLDGLVLLLNTDPDIEVIDTACTGKELYEKALKMEPDVVVTDIRMPGMNGIEAIKSIKAEKDIPCVVISTYNDQDIFRDALMAGTLGFIVKDAQRGEIIEGVKTVSKFQRFYCSACHMQLVRILNDVEEIIVNPPVGFSTREIEIIKYIALEISSEEIARRIYISKRAVDAIRGKLLTKMEVTSAVGIVKYALRHGLITLEDTMQ